MAQIEQTQQHTQRQRVIQESATGSISPASLVMGLGIVALFIIPVVLLFLDQGWQHGDEFFHIVEICIFVLLGSLELVFIIWLGTLAWGFISKGIQKWNERNMLAAGNEVIYQHRYGYDHLSAMTARAAIGSAEPQDEPGFEPYDEPVYTPEILKWHDKGLSPEGIANMLYLSIDAVKKSIRDNRPEVSDQEQEVLNTMRTGLNREGIAEKLQTTVHEVRKVKDRFKV